MRLAVDMKKQTRPSDRLLNFTEGSSDSECDQSAESDFLSTVDSVSVDKVEYPAVKGPDVFYPLRPLESPFLGERRPEHWKLLPVRERIFRFRYFLSLLSAQWERALFRKPTIQPENDLEFDFPEPTLLQTLVDNYFHYVNLESPLLHRPTFEKELLGNLHKREPAFGAIVLLVCAIGSRYTEDPRVRLSEDEAIRIFKAYSAERGNESRAGDVNDPSTHKQRERHKVLLAAQSRGWKYFEPAWNSRSTALLPSRAC